MKTGDDEAIRGEGARRVRQGLECEGVWIIGEKEESEEEEEEEEPFCKVSRELSGFLDHARDPLAGAGSGFSPPG